ncbi:helix-turn-helix transcriptional regulator [Thermodesulfovibrio sp.]|uniref:helix-turn-helix domain-containing protein n=1 Tax=Thermodesulfovibrio sp. TaxID=2067987 RepID=UPI0030B439DC
MLTIGEKIRIIRMLKILNQQTLADFAGVSQKTIVMYEKDINKPNLIFIDIFCKLTKVNPDWLLNNKLPIFSDKIWTSYFEITREALKNIEIFKKFFNEYVKQIEIYPHGYFLLECPHEQKIVVNSKNFNTIIELSGYTNLKHKEENFLKTHKEYVDFMPLERNMTKTIQKQIAISKIIKIMEEENISIAELQLALDEFTSHD